MPKRILFITRSLTSAHGGMQEYVRLLVPALRKMQDMELTVLSHTGGRCTLPFFFIRSAVSIIFFRGRFVHCGDAALSPLLLVAAAFRPGLLRSVTVYGLDLVFPSVPYQWVLRRSLPCAHRIVAISRATAKEARARGAPSSRIVVIPCGIVSAPVFGERSSRGKTLLLLGRQVRRKGTLWFLSDVLPLLLRECPDIRVCIAGDGPELTAIHKAVRWLQLGSSVTVLGRVSPETKESLFASSALFIMPNVPVRDDMEGFGIVCIEAAARGVPVVAADLEGVSDAVIAGETGLFFRPQDARHAADTVLGALAKHWDASSVRASCLQHFSIRSVSAQYVRDVFHFSMSCTTAIKKGRGEAMGLAGPIAGAAPQKGKGCPRGENREVFPSRSTDPRIGVVSWDFDPPLGGMGVHARTLAQGLRDAGVDVRVFSRDQSWIACGRNVGFSILFPFLIRHWIRKNHIDLLHLHTGPGGAFLLRSPGIPVLVTANHTYAQQSRLAWQGWKMLLTPFETHTYRIAKRVVCLSPDTADSVRNSYGIPASKIEVVPCGFPLGSWVRADKPLRERSSAVFVGRRDARKGFDLLLEAWTQIRSRIPGAVLHVVGFFGVSRPGVQFHGRLTDEALWDLVGSVRCLVSPSRLEGFGLAAAEAIAAGTPVVACDSDGIRSVVRDGVSGTLVPLRSDALADATTTLLQDDALWMRLHEGCLTERGRFDAANEVASYLSMFRMN